MREIFIDLSDDNHLQKPQIFGGYEGEHNATVLKVKLPTRMIETEYSGYQFDFQTSEGYKISLPYVQAIQDDTVSCTLPEQLMSAGKLLFNVSAILANIDSEVEVKEKTNTVLLCINDSPKGYEITIDPDGYRDELLAMIDARLLEIDPAAVDQHYSPNSIHAQSGKAVAEAANTKQDKPINLGEHLELIDYELVRKDNTTTVTIFGRKSGVYTTAFKGKIIIPQFIEGYPVTKLADWTENSNGLYNCNDIEEVVLPETIEYIGYDFFGGSYQMKLSKINFPKGLKTIKRYAFFHTSLQSVKIPENVVWESSGQTFTAGSTPTIIFADIKSTKRIPFGCFQDQTNLKTVFLPKGLESIADRAFQNCTSITDVYFGGTKSEWNALAIGANNDCLTTANIHYNQAPAKLEDVYNHHDSTKQDKLTANNDSDTFLIRREMPNYFTDYPVNIEDINADAYIDGKLSEVPDGDSFIFVTDMHYPENNKNSYLPMLYAYKRLGLNTVVHGGDVLHYTLNGKNIEALTLRKWTNDMRSCFGENMLPTYGNHDSNWAGMTDSDWNDNYVKENTVIPYKTVENIFLSGCKNHIVQETDEQIMQRIVDTGITVDAADMDEFIAWYKLHYYSDDVRHKTRHIVLNYVGFNTIFKKYFGNRSRELWAQLNWLYETIQNTPDDYNIVVTSHIIIDWQNNSIVDNNANKALAEIFKMLSFAKNNEKNYILLDAGQDGNNNGYYITKEIDFSNHNRTGKIICLCGHSHWDYSCVFYPWYKGTHTITAEEAASKTFTLDFTPEENSNVDIIIGNIKYRLVNSVATTYQGCCYIDRNTGKVYFSRYEAPFIEGAEIKISQWKSETYNDNSGLINDGILTIMTQTDAIRGANYSQAQHPGYPWDTLVQAPMETGTVTEQCFDIVTITDSGVQCTRIGAGENRIYQY